MITSANLSGREGQAPFVSHRPGGLGQGLGTRSRRPPSVTGCPSVSRSSSPEVQSGTHGNVPSYPPVDGPSWSCPCGLTWSYLRISAWRDIRSAIGQRFFKGQEQGENTRERGTRATNSEEET